MKELNFTHIKEPVRAHFGISRDEYALCSYIQVWGSHVQNKLAPYCNRYQTQMATWIGISRRGVIKMLGRLVDKKLIEQEGNGSLYSVTELWYEAVNMAEFKPAIVDYEEEIDSELSSQGVNKVHTKCEQSAQEGVNKVHTHNKSIVSNIKKSIVTKEKQLEIDEKKDGWYVPGDVPNEEEKVKDKTSPREKIFNDHAEKLRSNLHLPIKLKQNGIELLNDEHREALINRFKTHCLATEESHVNQTSFNKHFFNYTASRAKIKTEKNVKSSSKNRKRSSSDVPEKTAADFAKEIAAKRRANSQR